MPTDLAALELAAVDAVNYRVEQLGEPLETAVHAVQETLRARGVPVTLHLSTTSPATGFDGPAGIYEVNG